MRKITSMHQDMDASWMQEALKEAKKAMLKDEVPVGCVIVLEGEIIATGHNQTIMNNDSTAHAEVVALKRAFQNVSNHRLVGASLYVTLEPCLMCMGALVHARIDRLVYGASDPKTGAAESQEHHLEKTYLNHKFDIKSGVMSQECGILLKKFFRAKR